MEIHIWSDVVCPWCYLGKRRFEHALADFEHRDQVQVVHRAFELDPTAPKGKTFDTVELISKKYGISAEQFTAQQAGLIQMAAAEGLEYNLDGGRSGNTFDAHRLVRLGLERGRQDVVIERFFRGYFTEQRSLFEADSLVALSVEAGLDADEARTVLTEQRYTDAIKDDVQQARAYGANGVPFFVINERYGISGAQPTEAFAGALSRAWADHGTVASDTK
jgi:predicted DsbA family dithiol-disulfide isomerase